MRLCVGAYIYMCIPIYVRRDGENARGRMRGRGGGREDERGREEEQERVQGRMISHKLNQRG